MADHRKKLSAVVIAVSLAALLIGPGFAAAEKKAPEKPLNINTATAAELAQLPGVEEVIGASIVRHREVSGKFRSVDELLIVRGVSRKKLEKLRPYVRAEPEEKAGSSPRMIRGSE